MAVRRALFPRRSGNRSRPGRFGKRSAQPDGHTVWHAGQGYAYLELTEGYITRMALDKDNQVIGYEYVHMGKFMEEVKKGTDANEALKR